MIKAQPLFAIAWRLAILALPWQTRWIFSTPTVGGFPWEQGTAALYASWIVIAAAVLMGIGAMDVRKTKRAVWPLIAIAIFFATSFFTASPHATLLWWAHALVLIGFAWVLIRNHVAMPTVAAWFVISLIPHALIGAWQFAMQHAFASTLLGISEQISWQSGVSVVETTVSRVLRAYGGFPHPNIFGAWLATALVLLPDLIRRSRSAIRQHVWILCGALCGAVLVLTLSRGAWIAAAVGGTIAFVMAWKKCVSGKEQLALLTALVAILVIIGCVAAVEWDAVATRFQSSARLEHWSIEQRTSAIQDGLAAWRQRPLTGWGLGAVHVGVLAVHPTSPVAPEPPHLAPLVVLVETGMMGLIALITLVILLFMRARPRMAALPLLLTTGVLILTDHFFWTTWAGQALLALLLLLMVLPAESSDPRAS